MALAPVGISTYTRLEQLTKTITALKKNALALETELYIFSDAARPEDKALVEKVRNYIQKIDGFKKVHIVERKTNGRIKNSRGGISQLLNRYGKVIFLEEDIVTAPGFLQFMNEALNFYQNEPKVLSITGYSPPISIPSSLSHDSFTLRRFNGWGVGLWKDKYEMIEYVEELDFVNLLKSKNARKQFTAGGGEDMLPMLELEAKRLIDAIDVKAMYLQYKNEMVTVYPIKSLVQNIGHDGSGVHCEETRKFLHAELWQKKEGFNFSKDIVPNSEIEKSNQKFRRVSFKQKLVILMKVYGVYPAFKTLSDLLKK